MSVYFAFPCEFHPSFVWLVAFCYKAESHQFKGVMRSPVWQRSDSANHIPLDVRQRVAHTPFPRSALSVFTANLLHRTAWYQHSEVTPFNREAYFVTLCLGLLNYLVLFRYIFQDTVEYRLDATAVWCFWELPHVKISKGNVAR